MKKTEKRKKRFSETCAGLVNQCGFRQSKKTILQGAPPLYRRQQTSPTVSAALQYKPLLRRSVTARCAKKTPAKNHPPARDTHILHSAHSSFECPCVLLSFRALAPSKLLTSPSRILRKRHFASARAVTAVVQTGSGRLLERSWDGTQRLQSARREQEDHYYTPPNRCSGNRNTFQPRNRGVFSNGE